MSRHDNAEGTSASVDVVGLLDPHRRRHLRQRDVLELHRRRRLSQPDGHQLQGLLHAPNQRRSNVHRNVRGSATGQQRLVDLIQSASKREKIATNVATVGRLHANDFALNSTKSQGLLATTKVGMMPNVCERPCSANVPERSQRLPLLPPACQQPRHQLGQQQAFRQVGRRAHYRARVPAQAPPRALLKCHRRARAMFPLSSRV